MAKTITITVEDYELRLLEIMGKTIDFGGQGYDVHRKLLPKKNDNDDDVFADGNPSSDEAFRNFVSKVKNAVKDQFVCYPRRSSTR